MAASVEVWPVSYAPSAGPLPSVLQAEPPKPPKMSQVTRFCSFKNLQFEEIRLKTFDNWSHSFMRKEDLARNGWFSLHRGDKVQCAFCRGVIGFWDEGDEVAVEHKKHFPSCPFVLGAAVTNIPKDGSAVNMKLEQYLYRVLEREVPPERKKIYQTDSAAINSNNHCCQYPEFESREDRLKTFADPPSNVPDGAKMADAGFFLVGLSDMALCYLCGGGLFNWNKYDDPTKEHFDKYPACALSKRSSEDGERASDGAKKMKMSDEFDDDIFLEAPLAKKLLAYGFSADVIKAALSREFRQFGTLPVDINEAVEVMCDYEEECVLQ